MTKVLASDRPSDCIEILARGVFDAHCHQVAEPSGLSHAILWGNVKASPSVISNSLADIDYHCRKLWSLCPEGISFDLIKVYSRGADAFMALCPD